MVRTGARPGDWKAEPLPDSVAALAYTRRFSADEFERLRRGLVPEAMEERWFVVWHDDALWLHRSWTGFCIYRLRFAADGDGYAITEAIANRDREQYTGTDAHDLHALGSVLESVLEATERRR